MSTVTQPSKLSIIFAGELLEAQFLEGAPTQVRVRAMPARHLAKVTQLADKEAELLDLVCLIPAADKDETTIAGWKPVPDGWVDNLTDESHAKLYEAAKRLNFSRAAIWAERQIAAKEFTGEIAQKAGEAMMPIMLRLMESLASASKPSTSPASPSTRS